jgi:hypothetical protein
MADAWERGGKGGRVAMEDKWLDFASLVIGDLAWPVVVLIIVIILREHLRSLLEDLRSLRASAGGAKIEADFERTLEDAKKRLVDDADLPKEEGLAGGDEEEPERPQRQRLIGLTDTFRLRRLVQLYPRAAMVEGFMLLEGEIEQTAGHDPETERTADHIDRSLQRLLAGDIVNEGFVGAYVSVRELRNRAAHEEEGQGISTSVASDFVELVLRMIEIIRRRS